MSPTVSTRLKSLQYSKLLRYYASAGVGFLADVITFALLDNLLLPEFTWAIGPMAISKQTICFLIGYTAGVLVHFWVSKYFVFHEAQGSGRQQLLRFVLVAIVIGFGNYLVLKLMLWLIPQFLPMPKLWVDVLARTLAVVLVGLSSYSIHKMYTFKDEPLPS